jgi:hypothetical protein
MMGHRNDGSLNRFLMRFSTGTIAMSIIEPSLFLVFERFPDHKEAVKALYRESEDFQSLCEDYRQCAVALRHWRRSSEEHAPARREEYTLLLQELEEELSKILKVSEALDP